MLRVRVTARNFYRLEATGGPPKKPGGPIPRRAVKYAAGDKISVSESFLELHKKSLQVLGRDLGKDEGRGKTADETVSELETLRAEAAELGIEVDKRWRVGRLKSEIEAARAALKDPAETPGPDEDSEDDDAGE